MLDEDDIDAIAARVADKLRLPHGLVKIEEICDLFGLSRRWVYDHKDVLGAVRLGVGPKARLRFDVHRVRAALESVAEDPGRHIPQRRGRPKRSALPPDVPVIRPREP
jgi:hypothetical protein